MSTAEAPLRVLVGIDGSAAADLAVDFVARATWPADSHILVAEAMGVPTTISAVPGTSLAFVDFAEIEANVRSAAQQSVDAATARVRASGLRSDGKVLTGRAATALADEADALGADLIVVGSRGRGTIETMLLGSVSAELVDHARVSVLVVRTLTVERTVLAWDGTPGARAATVVVGSWPLFRHGSVRVVTVTDAGPPWWSGFPEPLAPNLIPMYLDAKEAARVRNRDLAVAMSEELRRTGLQAEPDPREGDPAAQILATATAVNADLIVMGTRGRSGVARAVLGSVARNVLVHARCSVLIVRDVTLHGDRTAVSSAPTEREPSEQSDPVPPAFATPWSDGT